MEDQDLKKFRKRWKYWLAQKTRSDRTAWVTLLESNWSGWALRVIFKHTDHHPEVSWQTTKEKIKEVFNTAIDLADIKELQALDGLYADEKYEKEIKK